VPQSALAAFSDIAFLLIIFFIVTANLTKPEGLVTQIPAAEEGETADQEMPTVQLDGRSILFNEKPLANFDELTDQLTALDLPSRTREEERIVQLEAKDNVAYQDYFQAMLSISKAGGQLTIVQREDSGQGGGS
jgi:biopolymer transport protein ExbD